MLRLFITALLLVALVQVLSTGHPKSAPLSSVPAWVCKDSGGVVAVSQDMDGSLQVLCGDGITMAAPRK